MTTNQILSFACLIVSSVNVWISFSNVKHAGEMIEYYKDKLKNAK